MKLAKLEPIADMMIEDPGWLRSIWFPNPEEAFGTATGVDGKKCARGFMAEAPVLKTFLSRLDPDGPLQFRYFRVPTAAIKSVAAETLLRQALQIMLGEMRETSAKLLHRLLHAN
jgi:hypothetical protein